jgi:hypothetical protein
MKSIWKMIGLVSIATLLPLTAACGGEDDEPDEGTGGRSSSSGGDGGSGNDSSTGGNGDAGSGPTSGCDLSGEGLPTEAVDLQITGDTTLTNDTVWILEDTTYVNGGATLTIEPCTRIEGEKTPVGTLVVSRGGRLIAEGTADEPILFTSRQPVGSRMAGDWGGVILLGRAPNFEGDNVTIEGLSDAPENQYGGSDPADSSGVLSYVRIEYSGWELSPDNEINGLTLGSVGHGTTLDHVMVSNTLDDGFEWFGGTVNGRYLVVNNAGDDMFDMDQGFRGHLQFLFGRQVAPVSSNPNGFECDRSNDGATPVTRPTVSNVTLCGLGEATTDPAIGAVMRERLEGDYSNLILMGFERGIDARDDFGTADSPNVEVRGSVFFGNFGDNIAPEETGEDDNDSGFDELAWIEDASRENSTDDPGFDCGPSGIPEPYPSSPIDGVTPGTGLDGSATYAGAFEDESDNWMTGLWVDWAED